MLTPFILAVVLQAQVPPPPEGVFRSRGYGWLIVRDSQDFRLFHEAAGACWPDPDGGDLEDIFARPVPRADGGIGLTEIGDDRATVYVFDPVAELPPACLAPVTDDRAAVVAIADLMQNYYPAFDERDVDFPARRLIVLDGLGEEPDAAQAFSAAQGLLQGLSDPHLELSAEIEGRERALDVSEGPTLDAIHARTGERPERAWLADWRSDVEQTVLEGRGHVAANNRVFWGVRDGVGYLNIVTMGGFDPDDDAALEPLDVALDEAMTAFAGTRAVIVDVSNNRGGYDGVGRHIAARFADRPRVAYLKRAWGSGVAYQSVEFRPSEHQRYLGPVWLLTSDVTVSAGETFAQMMRILPNVTHAGTRTRGAFSDQTPVVLANGWSFAMPMEIYVDPEGLGLEGHGLEPEVPVDLYPTRDLDHGHARAVTALMERLRRTPAQP